MQYSAYSLRLMCTPAVSCAVGARDAHATVGGSAQCRNGRKRCGARVRAAAAWGSAGFYAARAMALRTLALRACRLCSGVWPEVSTVISDLE